MFSQSKTLVSDFNKNNKNNHHMNRGWSACEAGTAQIHRRPRPILIMIMYNSKRIFTQMSQKKLVLNSATKNSVLTVIR